MKRSTLRNLAIAGLFALGTVVPSASAQMQGRGMMDGYDAGTGMGPGMMGGYGQGYGQGYGMMGPGMMMGGAIMGPGGMGMMGGYGPGYGGLLDLSEDQQKQLTDIQQKLIDNQWDHMRQMHRQMPPMWQAYQGEKVDVDAAMKAHEAMMEAGRAMMRQRLEAHNAMIDVLTEEQRERLRTYSRRGWAND